jgi:uncharacterized membrane protein
MESVFETIEQMQNESLIYSIIWIFIIGAMLLCCILIMFEFLIVFTEKYRAYKNKRSEQYRNIILRKSASKFFVKK